MCLLRFGLLWFGLVSFRCGDIRRCSFDSPQQNHVFGSLFLFKHCSVALLIFFAGPKRLLSFFFYDRACLGKAALPKLVFSGLFPVTKSLRGLLAAPQTPPLHKEQEFQPEWGDDAEEPISFDTDDEFGETLKPKEEQENKETPAGVDNTPDDYNLTR